MPKELVLRVTIHDCDVQTFKVSGNGGQHKDKTDAGVRIVHPPSGAVGRCTEERSQLQNTKKAVRRMAVTKEFQMWNRITAMKYPSIDSVVDEMLQRTTDFIIEVKDDKGKWTSLNS